jgi:hypothetical protein
MTKFAKLFDTNDDQVLVTLSADLEGRPCINVSCLAITLVGDTTEHVVVNQLRYADESDARLMFDNMDEATAREHAQFVRDMLTKQLDAERAELATRRDLS